MTITTENLTKKRLLHLYGRIDSTACETLQTQIMEAFQGSAAVTLDFQGVPYICSSGLRVLLLAQKTAITQGAALDLIHISVDVKNVLDMVGFSDILTLH